MTVLFYTGWLVLGATRLERQELYYNLLDDIAYSDPIDNYELYTDVDGIFKSMSMVQTVTVAYNNASVSIFAWGLKGIFEEADTEFSTQSPGPWGFDGSNEAVSYTGYHEHMPIMIVPQEATLDSVTYGHSRISQVCKKGDRWNVFYRVDELGAANTAGSSECFLQLMVVISPYKQGYQPTTSPMRHYTAFNATGDTRSYFSVQMPTSGYLTNASLWCFNPGTETQSPTNIIITPDLNQDALVNASLSAGTIFDHNLTETNSYNQTIGRMESADTEKIYVLSFKHFGRRNVKITGRKMLNFLLYNMEGTQFTDFMVVFEAEFVPYENAHFKQRWEAAAFSESKNYEGGYIFPVDVIDTVAMVITSITAGSGILEMKYFPKESEMALGAFSSYTTSEADIFPANASGEGVTAAINDLDLIPLSSSMGATTRIINVGPVRAGDRIGIDYRDTAALAGKVYIYLMGKIADQKYSKGSRVYLSPALLDLNEVSVGGRFR